MKPIEVEIMVKEEEKKSGFISLVERPLKLKSLPEIDGDTFKKLCRKNPVFEKNKAALLQLINADLNSEIHPYGNLPILEIMMAFEAKILDYVEPEGGYYFQSNKKIPIEGTLFSKETSFLSMYDVNQGELGDCFLLAPIASILSKEHGSSVILGMMRDLSQVVDEKSRMTLGKLLGFKDNTVIVRFSKKRSPFYAVVDKSVFCFRQQARSAAYIRIFEKAWAGVFCDKKMKNLDKGDFVYNALDGFLGMACRNQKIIIDVEEMREEKLNRFSNVLSDPKFTAEKTLLWLLNEDSKAVDHFLKARKSLKETADAKKLTSVPLIENMINYFKSEKYPKDEVDAKIAKLLNEKLELLQSKKSFSEEHEKILFNDLQKCLGKNYILTYRVFEFTSDSKDSSHGGEYKKSGLVGGHAYALVAGSQINFPDAEGKEIAHSAIKIYNPWGHGRSFESSGYGRSYSRDEDGKRITQESPSSTSWILISEMAEGEIHYLDEEVDENLAERISLTCREMILGEFLQKLGDEPISSVKAGLFQQPSSPSSSASSASAKATLEFA